MSVGCDRLSAGCPSRSVPFDDWLTAAIGGATGGDDAAATGADAGDGSDVGAGDGADDELGLIFLCCHPAFAPEVRVALTLRAVCGLSTAEVAAAFLVPEPTMAKRLVRAKAKIRDARISFRATRSPTGCPRCCG